MAAQLNEEVLQQTLDLINQTMTDIKDNVSEDKMTRVVARAIKLNKESEQQSKVEAFEKAKNELYGRDLINEFIAKKYGIVKKGTEKKSDKPKQAKSITGKYLEFIGDKNILDTTREDVSEWYDNMLDDDLSTLTIDTYRKMMKALFEYIMEEQEKLNVKVVPENYFDKVIVTPLRIARSALTDEQTVQFIDWAVAAGRENPVYADAAFFAEMLIGTGVRPGELLRVRVRDIDLKTQTILLLETKTNIPRRVVYPTVMRPRLNRWINSKHLTEDDRLISYTYEAIRTPFNYLARASEIKVVNEARRLIQKDENGNVIIDKVTGQPLKKPAVEIIKPHMLRHTFSTNLLNNKVPKEWVSKQMGHTTGNQTETTYFDLDYQALLKELDKFTPLKDVKELSLKR